jgi:hypothetical protein
MSKKILVIEFPDLATVKQVSEMKKSMRRLSLGEEYHVVGVAGISNRFVFSIVKES